MGAIERRTMAGDVKLTLRRKLQNFALLAKCAGMTCSSKAFGS